MGELAKGNILKMVKGTTGLPSMYIQVLNLEKNPKGRTILTISDSEHKMKALCPTSWDAKIGNGEMMEGSIIQIDNYVINEIQGKKMCVILALSVLQVDCVILGNPVDPPTAAPKKSGGFGSGKSFGSSGNNPFKTKGTTQQSGGSDEFQPVTSLSPFQRDFKIKVRVTRKGQIREWSNDRGTGKLFSVDLLDHTGGEIQATMFNDAVDKFYATFEEGMVYIIKRGRVKVANKRYTHINNDYSLDLSMDSDVEYVGEDMSISSMKYDFKPISHLADMQDKSYVDVCGVCDQVNEVQEFTSKSGKDLKKRTFRIVDQSGQGVDCTLWGDVASDFDPSTQGQVVCIKAARVSDFNGKSLSVNKYTPNPEGVKEVQALLQWWQEKGSSMNFNSMSKSGGAGGSRNDPPITIREFQDKGMGTGDAPDYFNLILTVKNIPLNMEKPPWYKAVPEEGIPAYKVIQSDDGSSWFCEKNQKTYENYKCRYILRMSAFDHTKDFWFNCYNDVAEKIIGQPASELEQYITNADEDGFKNLFRSLIGKQFNARVRVKQEVYQDEARQRCDILGVEEIDFKAECKRMMGKINEMQSAMASA